MKVAALCAGYGGLELAVGDAWPDAHLAWVAEVDPHASQVLEHRFGVPNLGDLTTIDKEALMPLSAAAQAESDLRAEHMYALYRAGMSMAQVAEQFGVTRQTVFKRFQRRNWETRDTYPRLLEPVLYRGRRFTFMKSTGYLRATDGDRELMHRYVWQCEVGDIPPGHDIHHVDGNRLNNDPTNLRCLDKADHTRLHAKQSHRGGDPTEPAADIVTAGFP